MDLRIELDGDPLFEVSLVGEDAVDAALDDRVLWLGELLGDRDWLSSTTLSLLVEMDAASGEAFATNVVIGVVPEPSTGALLALGVLAVAAGRRRARRPRPGR